MNLFSFVKSKVSIVDVVNEYTNLRRAGLYWKANCPFHQEKTASFTVSPHKEIFYCFGCHASGDIISFVARMENCAPFDAVKLLAERYNIELPDDLKRGVTEPHKKDNYYMLCAAFARWCHDQLSKNTLVQEYLQQRSINTESIERFQLGYFPGGLKSVKSLIQALQGQNIMAQDLLESHILENGQRGILYSPFEERLIFPIRDHMGRYCGFGGRVFKKDDLRPKYYNSREGAYFAKGSLLFGFDTAKRAIQETESLFLVEGYVDCIMMAQHGYHHTVATLGTACTHEHLKQLARYATVVHVLYDGDAAGQQAMIRLADLCWQSSLELKVIRLPASHDPASFLAAGNDLGPLIDSSLDIVTFFVKTLGADFAQKPLQEKLRLANRIIDILRKIEDPLKRDLLVAQAAQTLDMSFDTLKRAVEQGQITQKVAPTTPAEPVENKRVDQLSKLEKRIFFAIMNNIQLFNGKNEEYLIKYFCEPLRAILVSLRQERERDPSIDFVHFFDTLAPEMQHLVTKIVLEQEEQVTADTFQQLFTQFQKRSWKMAARTIALQIEQAKKNNNREAVQQLLQEFLELKQNMIQKNIV